MGDFDPDWSPQRLIKRPLRGKVCFLCEQPLERAAKGHCGSMFGDVPCWWVPTIAEHGGMKALRMSKERSAKQ